MNLKVLFSTVFIPTHSAPIAIIIQSEMNVVSTPSETTVTTTPSETGV
jgi:hypothetical protein